MIEQGKVQDGAFIRQISQTVSVFNDTDQACVEELWNAYIQDGESASGYAFVVYRDGADVLGYACFGPTPLTEGTYDLYWIAVHLQAQGRGVGHALMRHVEEAIRRHSGRLLLIETSGTPAYQSARKLYESAGYEREAVIREFYAPGDDLVIYRKLLSEK